MEITEDTVLKEEPTFSDGCHKWGWLIAIVVTAAMNLIMFAYFQGTVSQSLTDLKERVVTLEQRIDRFIQKDYR